MLYKSESQRRFFHSAGAKKAGISQKTIQEYDKASTGMVLPEKDSSKTKSPKTSPWINMKKIKKEESDNGGSFF